MLEYTLFNNNTPHSDQKLNYLVGTPVYAQDRAKSVLLTQFPASNIYILFKYKYSKLNYLTKWASATNYIIHFSDILFGLKSTPNHIYL